MGITVSAFTILLILRDAVLDPKYRDWFLLKYIPNWPWYVWTIIGVTALSLLALEGAYGVHKTELATFKKRYKTRVTTLKKDYREGIASARIEAILGATLTKPQPEEQALLIEQPLLEEKPVKVLENKLPEAQQVEAQESAPPKADPTLVCKKVYVIPVYWTGLKFIEEKEPKDDNLYAAIAEFVNRPNTRGYVPAISYLTAQITFYDAEGEYYHRVSHGYWLGHDLYHCNLDAGDKGLLVIAVGHRGHNMRAVENRKSEVEILKEKAPFEFVGKRFRIQAYVSAHRESATVFFDFAYKADGLPEIQIIDEGTG